TQTGSQGEDRLHPPVSRVSLYTEQPSGLCDRNDISRVCDPSVQSAGEIYREGIEANCDPPDVHGGNEPLPYTGRGYPGAFLDLYDHGGRTAHVCFYGDPSDLSCDGILDHDLYNLPQRTH